MLRSKCGTYKAQQVLMKYLCQDNQSPGLIHYAGNCSQLPTAFRYLYQACLEQTLNIV